MRYSVNVGVPTTSNGGVVPDTDVATTLRTLTVAPLCASTAIRSCVNVCRVQLVLFCNLLASDVYWSVVKALTVDCCLSRLC
jgi:hypothetical protein